MARQYQDPIQRRDFKADVPAATQFQTMARPVNTYEQQGEDPLFALANSLAAIEPGLRNYTQGVAKSEEEAGKLLHLQGQQLPEGASSSKARGFKTLQMGEMGRKARAELTDQVDALKSDPAFLEQWAHDPQGGIVALVKQRIAADTTDLTDPTMVSAYAQQVMPLMEQLPEAFSAYHRDVVQKETDQMVHARNLDVVSFDGTPEEVRAMYDMDAPTFEALGYDKRKREASFVEALIVKATEMKDPSMLDMTTVKDADGHAMTDNPALLEKIVKARVAVTKLDHDAILAETLPKRQTQWAVWETTLDANPWDEMFSIDNLMKEVHQYGALSGERDLGTLLGRIADKKRALLKAQDINTYVMPHESEWAGYSKNADFKKQYHADNLAIYQKIDWSKPAEAKQHVNELIRRHQVSTIPNEQLQGMAGALTTQAVNGVTGEIPPAMMMAIQLYHQMQAEYPSLSSSYFDGDTGTAAFQISRHLGAHDPNPKNITDAVEMYRLSLVSGKKELNENIDKDGKLAKRVEKEIDSQFTGLFTTDVDDDHMREIKVEAVGRVRELMKQGNLLESHAVEQVKMEMAGRYKATGDGGFIKVPKGVDGQALLNGREAWLKQYKQRTGNDPSTMFLKLNEDGTSYQLFDRATVMPIIDKVPATEILAAHAPVSYSVNADKDIAIAAPLKVALKERKMGTMASFVDENYAHIDRLLQGNTFTFMERQRIRSFMKQRDDQESEKSRAYFREVQGKNHSLLSPKSVFDGKTPLSTSMPAHFKDGTPGNAYELAAHFYDKSPVAAMIMTSEGVDLNPYKDNDGGWTIGFGFNMKGRTPKETMTTLRKAGVSQEDAAYIMKGEVPPGKKFAINTEQAVALLDSSIGPYQAQAEKVYGTGWNALPAHAKAVLIGIAYNTGNVAAHRKTLEAMKEASKTGDYDSVAKHLSVKYTSKDGKVVDNKRQVQIWREMLSGQYKTIISKKAATKKRK